MKLLVIGIDGGDKRIFDAMDMPRLNTLTNDGVCLPIEEDLWSRGWAEMLTGVHGRDTGAFYDKPKLDGSHDFTQSFGMRHLLANKDLIPIWVRAMQLGHRIGFMNVPTTMPAPEVDGFLVSGAGGGLGKLGTSIPAEACHPKEISAALSDMHYILDTRVMASGIERFDLLLDRMIAMTRARGNAFAKLARQFEVDFGFVAFMSTSRMQNLAMSEVEPLLIESQTDEMESNTGVVETDLQVRLRQLYRALDDAIGLILDSVEPEHTMIVADHGAVPYLHQANVNRFLCDAGYQKPLGGSSLRSVLRSMVRSLVPARTRRKVSSKARGLARAVRYDADWAGTQAFGSRYVPGIYLNDRERFRGPVDSEEGALQLVEEIVANFNGTEEADRFEMTARPYRACYAESKFQAMLPDIWIDKPDTLFFEGKEAFVSRNREYGPLRSMRSIGRDMFTGIKGRYPLVCADGEVAKRIRDDDPSDLTVVYRIIERFLAS